jgi:hypothetical protein
MTVLVTRSTLRPDDVPRRLRRDQDPFGLLVRRILDGLVLRGQHAAAPANRAPATKDLRCIIELLLRSDGDLDRYRRRGAGGMAADDPRSPSNTSRTARAPRTPHPR